jgi:hypothetical protein
MGSGPRRRPTARVEVVASSPKLIFPHIPENGRYDHARLDCVANSGPIVTQEEPATSRHSRWSSGKSRCAFSWWVCHGAIRRKRPAHQRELGLEDRSMFRPESRGRLSTATSRQEVSSVQATAS